MVPMSGVPAERPSAWRGVPHSDRKSALNGGRFGLLHALADHLPELRRVLVGMHCNRVLHRGFDELLLGVSGDPNGAVHFAWDLAAIDVLPCHAASFLRVGQSSIPLDHLSRARIERAGA